MVGFTNVHEIISGGGAKVESVVVEEIVAGGFGLIAGLKEFGAAEESDVFVAFAELWFAKT